MGSFSMTSVRRQTVETYGVSSRAVTAIVAAPLLLLAAAIIGLAIPATRPATSMLLSENRPVELLTFLFAGLAGAYALVLAVRIRRTEHPLLVAFYAVFAIGLLLVAMEEISWGQTLFHWRTPAGWNAVNRQHETNLHNLTALGGHNDWFRLAFGVGGLVGVALGAIPAFRRVATPVVLAPCFLLITVHAGIDFANDFVSLGATEDWVIQRSSEMVELIIALGAAAYLALNARLLAPRRATDERRAMNALLRP
jgi:hypothetical protein